MVSHEDRAGDRRTHVGLFDLRVDRRQLGLGDRDLRVADRELVAARGRLEQGELFFGLAPQRARGVELLGGTIDIGRGEHPLSRERHRARVLFLGEREPGVRGREPGLRDVALLRTCPVHESVALGPFELDRRERAEPLGLELAAIDLGEHLSGKGAIVLVDVHGDQ